MFFLIFILINAGITLGLNDCEIIAVIKKKALLKCPYASLLTLYTIL